jgi:hypothetical protein
MITTSAYKPKSFLLSKIEALKARTELLTGLNKVVSTKDFPNIKPDQWYAINNQLNTVANKISYQLDIYTDRYLIKALNGNEKGKLINALGEIELELSQAYSFYDTYMDILTQRLSPVLGPLLRGCDAIAADGLKHEYLTTVTKNPIVYCDRGFGASILREGVTVAKTVNPIAFIAIPYSRLAEKYNLISIYHEVGHQALNKLNLVEPFQQVFSLCAKNAGANQLLQNLFANWSKEIIPDFWAFGFTGMGQTSSMRDVLLVPQEMALSISPYQQHPPTYLRFLISVEWCRFLWGRGDWDEWAEEWDTFYPVENADKVTKEIILQAKKILPNIARASIITRFKKLSNKNITSMFDMDRLNPINLKKCTNKEHFSNQSIGVQLSAFRLMRDKKNMPIAKLNAIIHAWLINLNDQTISNHN